MGDIVRATNVVHGREPCFELAEVNKVLPIPGDGLRRMQVIRVVRNDQLWEYRRDMGSAKNFKAEEFIFPGAVPLGNGRFDVLETVERLQGAADDYRAKYDMPTPRSAPPTDFVKGFEEFATRRRDARKGRRTFVVSGGRRNGHNAISR